MVHKLVLFTAVALFAAPLAGAALAAGASDIALVGKDPGTDAAYSCFTRQYDAAHLKAHPKQNVSSMSVFVESTYDNDPDVSAESRRTDFFEVGVNFRNLVKAYQTSGSCESAVDGKKGLSCGGDCGGGDVFDVTTGKDGITMHFPSDASVWDPDDDSADLPKGATFGRDDRTFVLTRVDVKQCQSLMSADAKHALYGTPLPPDDNADATGESADAPATDTPVPDVSPVATAQ